MHHYRWNLHVHTHRSICGKPEMRLPDVLARCRDLGFEAVAITDHVNDGTREELQALQANRKEIAEIESPLLVLLGAEATMRTLGRITMTAREAAGLDFLMVACNHEYLDWPSREPSAVAAHCLAATEAAIASGYCDVIPHPLLCKLMPAPMPEIAEAYDWESVAAMLAHAAAGRVAMELNPRLVRMFPDFFRRFIGLGSEAGVKFTVGTDAHELAALAYDPEVHAGPQELQTLGLPPCGLLRPEELVGRR